jgi:hypothetical protein
VSAYSAHADQLFRLMPTTDSGPCRPPVPLMSTTVGAERRWY